MAVAVVVVVVNVISDGGRSEQYGANIGEQAVQFAQKILTAESCNH